MAAVMTAGLLCQQCVRPSRQQAASPSTSVAQPARVPSSVFRAPIAAGTLVCRAPAPRAVAIEAETSSSDNTPTPSYVSISDKYAVIDVGGTQHLVEEGRWYTCNRLKAEPGSKIQFARVLALKSGGQFQVGRPYLEDVKVEAEILEELKGPKLVVYKMKPKKHYRNKTGHRQLLTKFLITKISTEASS
ncbi:hypothetical protein WJX72_005717 [[Myrmecia] bisecta]|uniref:50S ribosomal protein L21, chloroplastic n=1 Tax=[Myrmecia] bisecta TaxID=41462 RepID=A0AAW1QAK5_9CHLO